MALVDGELSEERRRSILKALDANEGDWRRCALLFLEDQVMRTAFASGASAQSDRNIMSSTCRHAAISPPSKRQDPGNVSWSSFLTLAAGLALAFTIGMQVGNPFSESMDDSMATSAPRITPNLVDSQPNLNWPESRNTVYVHDDGFWDRGDLVPSSVRKSFRNLGAEVRSERGWMPVRTEDGRQLIIPYEDVQLVPVSGTSY